MSRLDHSAISECKSNDEMKMTHHTDESTCNIGMSKNAGSTGVMISSLPSGGLCEHLMRRAGVSTYSALPVLPTETKTSHLVGRPSAAPR